MHGKGGSILVSASEQRTQPANLESALRKVKNAIVEAAGRGLVGETSEAQKGRVRRLEEGEKRRTRREKEERGGVKKGRKEGRGREGWD